ncbi:ABC transporter permease [Candidatus Kaiserbacteria bacterium]|nr:ABC transporter permease [Candidatus Kaiserbacteria bacterium]
MLWVNTKRVLRSGFVNLMRNSFVSLASVFVMTMTLLIIGSLMFVNALISDFVSYVRDKVDVNVYFVTDADEKSILDLKTALENIPEVAAVTYTSKDDAFAAFRAKHQDDQLTLQALDELGKNPFGSELSIKAKQPSQYEAIAQFLQERTTDPSGKPFIDSVNYLQNKTVIDQLDKVTSYVERFGWGMILIFALASILITFNTIRLAIYTAREEISVMRLVGASNMYIRGPFIVEGTLYGGVSGIIALIVFFPLAWLLRGPTESLFGANVLSYYISHFWLFLLVLLCTGAILGAVSSFLAVRKYLSV